MQGIGDSLCGGKKHFEGGSDDRTLCYRGVQVYHWDISCWLVAAMASKLPGCLEIFWRSEFKDADARDHERGLPTIFGSVLVFPHSDHEISKLSSMGKLNDACWECCELWYTVFYCSIALFDLSPLLRVCSSSAQYHEHIQVHFHLSHVQELQIPFGKRSLSIWNSGTLLKSKWLLKVASLQALQWLRWGDRENSLSICISYSMISSLCLQSRIIVLAHAWFGMLLQ